MQHPILDPKTGLTGELWSKTNFLKWLPVNKAQGSQNWPKLAQSAKMGIGHSHSQELELGQCSRQYLLVNIISKKNV